MNKALIEIYYPALMKNYDIWVPKKMLVRDAVKKIAEEISAFELNENLFDVTQKTYLFFYEQNRFLLPDDTIGESGVNSGSRLMII